MDLHVIGPLASPAERSAVDAVLGPARSGWAGGPRDATLDGHVAHGGREARSRRDLLLPALHALQDQVGYISEPGLAYISRRLTVPPAEAYGVASFYALLSTRPRPAAVAHLCDDLACRVAGAEAIAADLERSLGPAGSQGADVPVGWQRSPCLGLCDRAPATLLTTAGEGPRAFTAAPVDAAGVLARLEARAPSPADGHPPAASIPQAGDPSLRLTGRIGAVDPLDLAGYRGTGGYDGLIRALALGPEGVVEAVTAARLVGRGGAAFPTGRKWAGVAAQPGEHLLVCNADESEPGTFKDRIVLEGDPFAVIEGMTIAAYATSCHRGYLYLRGEYPEAEATMIAATEAARAAGLLGPDILGSGFGFEIELRRGAGAYICGEETALFESIEGQRGEPRNKPPFPVTHGLFGRPTVVNNVETLVNVPLILRDGPEAYAAIGTEGSTGPKLFCLSGHVERPGLYEVPFGTTLGELLDLAGRPPGGPPLQAVLLGGAAGTFVGPDELDVALTFEGTRAIGAALGSGVVLALDRTVDMVDLLGRIARFFRDESCGQCVPCRIGTVRQEEAIARLAAAREATVGAEDAGLADVDLLRELGQGMRDASICGLGQTASSAIESALARGLVTVGSGAPGPVGPGPSAGVGR